MIKNRPVLPWNARMKSVSAQGPGQVSQAKHWRWIVTLNIQKHKYLMIHNVKGTNMRAECEHVFLLRLYCRYCCQRYFMYTKEKRPYNDIFLRQPFLKYAWYSRVRFKHKSKIETACLSLKPHIYSDVFVTYELVYFPLLLDSLACLSAFKWLLISADHRHLIVMSDSSSFSIITNLPV